MSKCDVSVELLTCNRNHSLTCNADKLFLFLHICKLYLSTLTEASLLSNDRVGNIM